MSHERRTTTGGGRATHDQSSESDIRRSTVAGSGAAGGTTDRSAAAAAAASGGAPAEGASDQLSLQDAAAAPLQLSTSGRTTSSSKPPGGGGLATNIRGKTTKSSGKDRHSKVNTARGPRDRRVRLSVSTAIQFYDIQDRLGFDQPSKAIEWLLKKAKPAIDELNQLPPTPLSIGPVQTGSTARTVAAGSRRSHEQERNSENSQAQQQQSSTPRTATSEDSGLHGGTDHVEFSELDLVNRGGSGSSTSRAKARERARERAKDSLGSRAEMAAGAPGELAHQESSLFAGAGSVFDHVQAPVCSSFTQLLQSPFPSSLALQSFITPSQNFMQNQLLQGLYHPPPPPPQAITQGFLSSNFQRYGGAPQQQEQDFMLHQHHQSGAGAEGSSEGSGPGPQAFFSDHHKSYSQSFHSLQGSGGSSNLPWIVSPAAQQQHHHQQQQHQASSNLYGYRSTLPPSGLYNYPLLQQDPSSGSGVHRQLQSPGPAPFYLVPARIQGIGEEELQQQEQQQQQKRARQDE